MLSSPASSLTFTISGLSETCLLLMVGLLYREVWASITLARTAASCSCVGQPMMVCCSLLYSALRTETRLTKQVRMLDRTGLKRMNSVSLLAR